jgi:hypothetical protein
MNIGFSMKKAAFLQGAMTVANPFYGDLPQYLPLTRSLSPHFKKISGLASYYDSLVKGSNINKIEVYWRQTGDYLSHAMEQAEKEQFQEAPNPQQLSLF